MDTQQNKFLKIFSVRSNNSIISLSYLLSLCKDLADPFFRSSFLGGPYLKSGRRVLIDENETEAIKLFVALDNTKVIHSMKLDFVQLYHGLLLPQQQQQQQQQQPYIVKLHS